MLVHFLKIIYSIYCNYDIKYTYYSCLWWFHNIEQLNIEQFWCVFVLFCFVFCFLFNGLCWELLVVCRQISSIFCGFRETLPKETEECLFPIFESFFFIFHPSLMQVFLSILLNGLLMGNKNNLLFYFEMGVYKGSNFQWVVLCAFGSIWTLYQRSFLFI